MDKFSQSYSQAPWRKQLQFIGLFSLFLVFLALIAGIYLSVSAQAAKVGRTIQDMQRETEAMDLEIENLQAQLALIKTADEMERRAEDLGFSKVQVDEIVYLKIPGYYEPQGVVLAPYQGRTIAGAKVMPEQFTESLFSWLQRQFANVTLLSLEVSP
jgi:cell division protein FtsB